MTDDEINMIIADYDLGDCDHWGYGLKDGEVVIYYDNCSHTETRTYTKSLDALVPVWEKMRKGFDEISITTECDGNWDVNFFKFRKIQVIQNSLNIQQAAAHATAKAILELKGDG
jgi:hypothetical protein